MPAGGWDDQSNPAWRETIVLLPEVSTLIVSLPVFPVCPVFPVDRAKLTAWRVPARRPGRLGRRGRLGRLLPTESAVPVIVTLLSDFGSGSPYPAQMKAILASSCEAVLIDITHDVPRHDVRAGGYLLAAVAPTTPAGTGHPAGLGPGGGRARAAPPPASPG